MKTTKRIFWVAVILILGLFAYSFLGAKGSIVITSPLDQTIVYLDNVSYRTIKKDSPLSIRIDAGVHTIITSRDGYFPWTKDVEVVEGETITLSPFMLPSNPSGEIITGADPEHDKIVSLVKKAPLPVRESRKRSDSGNVEIWVAGNTIYANWIGKKEEVPVYFCLAGQDPCDTTIEIFRAESVENLDFYANREDVLIFSAGNGVMAIEMDGRGDIKNSQPLYLGTRPHFFKQDASTLYVLDGETLAQIAI
ncbi:MAG: hypothetical protein RJA61_528 [Candidatus Parcubacteria bacterium]|jgi:hypothetical protein